MLNKNEEEKAPLIIDEEFARWAFGDAWDGYKTLELDILDMMYAWDELHSDIWPINPIGNIFQNLMDMRKIYDDLKYEDDMDKKMHKVTEQMKTAQKEVSQGKKKAAVDTLKKAEKKNEKLVKIDREVRDPLIKKCKKEMG